MQKDVSKSEPYHIYLLFLHRDNRISKHGLHPTDTLHQAPTRVLPWDRM